MKKQKGFTLLEMMITVIIIGILAVIALPSYQNYLRVARRSDALDALMFIQNLQEKYRANNSTYGSLAQIGYSGATSKEGYYTPTITSNSATGYTATATAVSGTTQASDSGCTAITITVSAANPRGAKTPASCWKK